MRCGMSAETIERVAHMSPSTIDRALASSRPGLPKRGISTTRPGTLLKHQVAIKTFADWTETVPGFVEVDLVAHCGWTGAGPFLYTLTLVDVATGWVSCAGLRDKRAQTVLAALHRLHEGLPFKILGLDSDSGSEFLNAPLVEYCAAHRITFTRGRPYRKNDSCFVEQKNWAVVRRLVGYQRLEAPALAALERIHELSRDYVNFLHPVRKLTEKVRRGARITRRYDAAQTPYRRLLATGVMPRKTERQLTVRWAAVNPLRLKLELESAQRTLAERAVQPIIAHPPSVGRVMRQPPRLWSDPVLTHHAILKPIGRDDMRRRSPHAACSPFSQWSPLRSMSQARPGRIKVRRCPC